MVDREELRRLLETMPWGREDIAELIRAALVQYGAENAWSTSGAFTALDNYRVRLLKAGALDVLDTLDRYEEALRALAALVHEDYPTHTHSLTYCADTWGNVSSAQAQPVAPGGPRRR